MENTIVRGAKEHADKELQTITKNNSDLAVLIQQRITVIEEILNCYDKFHEGVEVLLQFLRLKEGLIENSIPFDQTELELAQTEHQVYCH